MAEPANPDLVVEDGMDLDEADPGLQVELDFHGDLLPLAIGFTLRVESEYGNHVLFTEAPVEARHIAGWLVETAPKAIALSLLTSAVARLLLVAYPGLGSVFMLGGLLNNLRNPLKALFIPDPSDLVEWWAASQIQIGHEADNPDDIHPGIRYIAY